MTVLQDIYAMAEQVRLQSGSTSLFVMGAGRRYARRITFCRSCRQWYKTQGRCRRCR